MAVGRGAAIDRPVELQRAADVGRRQPEQLRQHLLELLLVDLAGAVGIDQERHRIGDADRVGDLDGAAVGEAGRDHVLGEIARGIGGRAVDLGRILAGERAAAMRRVAAIGVDDDLAAGQAAIAVGAADHEFAGRIDQEVRGLLRHPALRQRRSTSWAIMSLIRPGEYFLPLRLFSIVLGRDHDLGAADRLAVDILHRDLALGVGLQVEHLAAAALFRHHLQDLVREENRRGHQRALFVDFALVAGVTEHHALVAGALFFAALLFLGVDALAMSADWPCSSTSMSAPC